jgi:hypothetical protein
VGGVLEPYDTDKLYPVYGFGAKVRTVCCAYSGSACCWNVRCC